MVAVNEEVCVVMCAGDGDVCVPVISLGEIQPRNLARLAMRMGVDCAGELQCLCKAKKRIGAPTAAGRRPRLLAGPHQDALLVVMVRVARVCACEPPVLAIAKYLVLPS